MLKQGETQCGVTLPCPRATESGYGGRCYWPLRLTSELCDVRAVPVGIDVTQSLAEWGELYSSEGL